MKPGPQAEADPVDRWFAGVVLHAQMRRGVSHQELLDLAIRYKRLDVAKHLLGRSKQGEAEE